MEEQPNTKLTANPRRELLAALADWPSWPNSMGLTAEPEIVAPLGIDSSNNCHLVDCGGRTVVARIRAQAATALKLDVSTEWQAHRQAWIAGLAPEPLHFDTNIQLFVSHYHAPDAGDAIDTPEAIATLLNNIHRLPGVETQLMLEERFHTYGALAAARSARVYKELLSMEPNILRIAKRAQGWCHSRPLCHNDLLRANRLLTRDGILALDWEYAAMGDPYFDLAVICRGDGFERDRQDRLLRAYDTLDNETRERLELNLVLYDYIALLWWLATTEAGEDTAITKLATMIDSLESVG
ncbi:MAG: thiamine kinase [Halieaceae bacterium]|jgi:thiamine kinase